MAGEIEFLDSEPPPENGEHPSGSQPARGGRRDRLVGGLAVGALIVGVLVARAVSGGDSSPVAVRSDPPTVASSPRPAEPSIDDSEPSAVLLGPAAQFCATSGEQIRVIPIQLTPVAPPAAPSGPRSAPVSRAPVLQTRGASLTPGNVVRFNCVEPPAARCPPGADEVSECTNTAHLPAAVLDAVRDEYPGAQIDSSFTEFLRRTKVIYFRSVMLTVNPDVSLEITLQQPGFNPGRTRARNYGTLVQGVRAVHRAAHLTAIVQFSGRFGRRTSLAKVSRLAADRRLRAVG